MSRTPPPRALAWLAAAAACLCLVLVAPATAATRHIQAPDTPFVRSLQLPLAPLAFGHGQLRPSGFKRLAVANDFWGGPITASNGEVVNVFSSTSYPQDAVDQASMQAFADFVAALPHGSELASLGVYVVTPEEMTGVCGNQALACYGVQAGQSLLIIPGQWPEGFPEMEVVTHEYGHHIANNRDNSPWHAIDWGPKRWATAMNVCAQTKAGKMFPGDEGDNYDFNPGEAWSESYRTAVWGANMRLPLVVDSSMGPSAAALAAASADVTTPWVGPTESRVSGKLLPRTVKKRVGKKLVRRPAPPNPRTLTVATPLDGTFDVLFARAPARATVAIVDPATGEQLALPSSGGTATICGQRSVKLVVRAAKAGAFSLDVSIP